MRRIPTALVLLVLPLLLATPSDDAAAGPAVGEAFPPLRLPTLDGKTFDLRKLRGQKVLLIEFASW